MENTRIKRKRDKKLLSSIIYIQAAVYANTGIKVKLDELMALLVEENLITRGQIRDLAVPDLNRFGQSYTPTEKKYETVYTPVDVVVTKWPGLPQDDKRVEIENHE